MPISTKDQSPYETYGEFLNRTLCENSCKIHSQTNITPKCYEGKREYECIVKPNEHPDDKPTTLTLCEDCKNALVVAKHIYKYSTKVTKLEV